MRTQFTMQQLADPATAVSAQAIRKCVHCGFCTATCPTYVLLGDERDSPRGRIYLMKEMLEKRQAPTADVVRHIDRCLSCLACTTTCPSGVDYMHLIDHSRAYVEQRYRRPINERMLRWLLAKVLPSRTRLRIALRLARPLAPLASVLARSTAFAPLVAMLTLSRHAKGKRAPAQNSASHLPARGRVLLMQGCAESLVRPQIRAAAVRLLNRIGYDVVFSPAEQCCGALVHHLGRETQSLASMRHEVDVWTRTLDAEASRGGVDAIVILTSGCGTFVKDYGFVLRDDAAYAGRAARISQLACDIAEWVKAEDVRAKDGGSKLRIAYHAACSLQHGQKIVDAPKVLLEAAGFDVRVPAEAHLCCGSAGVYNILQPKIASELGARKAARLHALDAQAIVTGNVGCITQIAVRSSLPVVHTVELLDWASGGPSPLAVSSGEA